MLGGSSGLCSLVESSWEVCFSSTELSVGENTINSTDMLAIRLYFLIREEISKK